MVQLSLAIKILSSLTQCSLATCLLVCKEWYTISRQPSLYNENIKDLKKSTLAVLVNICSFITAIITEIPTIKDEGNDIDMLINILNSGLIFSLSDYYEMLDDDNVDNALNSYYWKLPSSFSNLKELYLDFKLFNDQSSFSKYKFNESTLESIPTTCPLLMHLTLCEFNFNFSTGFIPSNSSTILSSTNFICIQSSTQLQYLYLDHCHLYEPECYKYIQYKYPSVTSLNLDLMYLPLMSEFHYVYKSAIGNLNTSYVTLAELKVHFTKWCTKCYSGGCNIYHSMDNQAFWPDKEQLTWLMIHPTQLVSLQYPFNLFIIEKEDHDGW
ncbi:unnamed protein product [Cunninghamella blakesleeana]